MATTKQTQFTIYNPTTALISGTTFGARLGVFSLTEYATQGQLLNDAQPAFDQALADAKTAQVTGGIAGGVIVFPVGSFFVTQMQLSTGIFFKGAGPGATVVSQKDGSNVSMIVNSPTIPGLGYLHYSGVSDMSLRKRNPTPDTLGSAIELNCRMGEVCHFTRISMTDWPQSGIRLNRGATPGVFRDVHGFRCGEYLVDLRRTPQDVWHMLSLDTISGDSHKKGLIHIQGAGTGFEIFRICNVKAENAVEGAMPCVIDLDGLNNIRGQIENVSVSANRAVQAIIRISSSTVKLLGGLLAVAGAGGTETLLIDDIPAGRQVAYDGNRLGFTYTSANGIV